MPCNIFVFEKSVSKYLHRFIVIKDLSLFCNPCNDAETRTYNCIKLNIFMKQRIRA